MISLAKLPYAEDALQPHISAETIQYHYHKHHQGYVDKLNNKLSEQDCAFDNSSTLEEIIRQADGKLYDLAAQVWNHDFYWQCLDPSGGGEAPVSVAKHLERHFGSVSDFLEQFKSAALGEFGSGWAWLVRSATGDLQVVSTTDAQNPISDGMEPLLVVDVWEHAYYLDYRNDRKSYVETFCKELLNWHFLEQNLGKAE